MLPGGSVRAVGSGSSETATLGNAGGSGHGRFALQTQRDAQDIGRIWLQHDGLAFAVEFQPLAGRLRDGCDDGENDSGENGGDG